MKKIRVYGTKFMEWKGHMALALIARWYLAYVFIAACLHKIQEPAMFALDVATYQILPLYLINLMAITLPWIELGVGIMFIIGFRVRAAALMIAGMMVMFMIALYMALEAGLDMSCGCFASSATEEDVISYATMLRDSVWLLLAVYVLFFDRCAIGVDWLMYRRGRENDSQRADSEEIAE